MYVAGTACAATYAPAAASSVAVKMSRRIIETSSVFIVNSVLDRLRKSRTSCVDGRGGRLYAPAKHWYSEHVPIYVRDAPARPAQAPSPGLDVLPSSCS